MAARTVARAIFTRRQRDGLASALWFRGGRVRDLPGNLLGDNGDDQPCVDPRSCEFGFLGRQLVEPSQAFEPLERHLNLPTKAIESEDVGRREGIGGRRGGGENKIPPPHNSPGGVPFAPLCAPSP